MAACLFLSFHRLTRIYDPYYLLFMPVIEALRSIGYKGFYVSSGKNCGILTWPIPRSPLQIFGAWLASASEMGEHAAYTLPLPANICP